MKQSRLQDMCNSEFSREEMEHTFPPWRYSTRIFGFLLQQVQYWWIHITLQLPSFGTSAIWIAWLFMAMFGIGSLNLMCRLSSSVVGKTNTSFSFHSLEIISYFHRWKRHIKQLYFKTLLHENPDEFSLKVILISWNSTQLTWEAFITKN